MPNKESFKKGFYNTLRVAGAASIGLAPYTPVFSPQEKAQSAKDNGHTLTVDTPLNLDGLPKTLEAPDGTKIIFGNTEREQAQTQEVSVFGVQAGFNPRGNLMLSGIDGQTREIVLPPVGEFLYGKVEFSPDGSKIALWRRSLNPGKPGFETGIYLVRLRGGNIIPLSPEFLDPKGEEVNLMTWSSDSRRLAIGAGHHGGGKTVGIDVEARQALFEVFGSLFGKFSPDGNWFAKEVGRDTEIVGMDGKIFKIPNAANFAWTPDNKGIALISCTNWMETAWGDICQKGRLRIFDLASGRLGREIGMADAKERPVFSANGQKLLFKSDNPEDSGLRIYDLTNGKTQGIYIYPRIAVVDEGWRKEFHESGLVLLYQEGEGLYFRNIFWVNPDNGEVVSYQRAEIEKGRLNDYISTKDISALYVIYGVKRDKSDRVELYRAPINFKVFDYVLEGVKTGSYVPQREGNTIELFGLLKDGNRLISGDRQFLFMGGRKYPIEHTETAEYFGGQAESLPEVLVAFIPEGENISFRPGNAVGDKENKDFGIWYLRNGKRYRIQNWEWFLRGQRRPPETEPVSVDKTILERIPEGEPTLVQKEGEMGWLDWDGNFIEFQPYGGRMIIFIGGYDGSTSSQIEAFRQIKEKLVEKGWRRTQFLEATYNIDIEALHRGEIKPKEYKSEDTKLDPMLSASKLRLQARRYKEMLPLTNFIIMGHSLGGLEGFEASLGHTDSTEMVITLDSPLKGVDRAALNEHFGPDIDGIIRVLGEAVGRYLVSMAENPAAQQAQEDKTAFLRSRGVKVFTFSNDDDWFVRNRVSVLDNSDSEFEGQSLELIRHLGHLRPRGPGDFLTGHGQVLQEGSFLEELARILPAS